MLILSEACSVSAAKEQGKGEDKDVKRSSLLRWVAVKLSKDVIFWVATRILGEFGRWVAEILEKDKDKDRDGVIWVETGR